MAATENRLSRKQHEPSTAAADGQGCLAAVNDEQPSKEIDKELNDSV